VKLAVFTSKYPARVATFFERDMRGLLDAGIEIEVFPIYPLDPGMWRHSLEILSEERLPRDRVHHLALGASIRRAPESARARGATMIRDALAVLGASARFGPMTLAKTGYTLPKAWAWAADHAGRFDHVLAYWGNYAGTCAYAFHRLLDRPIPFTIWLHAGADLYEKPAFMRQKLLYADNILTCCEFNRAFIRQRFADLERAIAPKLHVCHHGLDLGEFPYRPDGRPADRVIAVGRLSRYKGFDYLFAATRILADRGVAMTVDLVGDGEERAELEALSTRLGIADRVRFRGWLPFPEVRRAMSEATLLVHPSDGLGDGLPNVIREAMAVGTPVIGSHVAGLPDALGDGCGVLVPPKDPAMLADAIAAVLADPVARGRMARSARQRVEERYDLWRNSTVLAGLLRNTRRKSPGPLLSAAAGRALESSARC
jgi:glycosyltransferase involved in cell wall biosynthesis